ncbi:MAG: hydroxymethylbilane synthase [Lachnospirales bacterium]
MANFPMFVSLKNKKCLVVGGGAVAKRKSDTLIKYGGDVFVLAEDIKYDFNCKIIKKSFEERDITDYFIVIAATNNRSVNKKISEICHKKKIHCNIADSSSDSSFVFGASCLIGETTIAVNSGEDNPNISKDIRDSIMKRVIKIGTRKSKLAKAQTQIVADLIKKADSSIICQIVEITTKGDIILDKKLSEFNGKGIFIDEFEKAIANGTIDIAVHSGKDLPIDLMEGMEILATPKKTSSCDVLVTMKNHKLNEKSIIGTSSLRREKQINYNVKNIRGNVDTRLKKLENGEYDGIILAYAGLERLGLLGIDKYDYKIFDPSVFYPAPCQGIIAVEGKKDSKFKDILKKINDYETSIIFNTERALIKNLNLGCHTPIGAYTELKDNKITLSAAYLRDTKKYVTATDIDYNTVAEIVANKIRND